MRCTIYILQDVVSQKCSVDWVVRKLCCDEIIIVFVVPPISASLALTSPSVECFMQFQYKVFTPGSWWSVLLATVSVGVSSPPHTRSGQLTNTAILSTTAGPVTNTSYSPRTRPQPSLSALRLSVGRREFSGRSVHYIYISLQS